MPIDPYYRRPKRSALKGIFVGLILMTLGAGGLLAYLVHKGMIELPNQTADLPDEAPQVDQSLVDAEKLLASARRSLEAGDLPRAEMDAREALGLLPPVREQEAERLLEQVRARRMEAGAAQQQQTAEQTAAQVERARQEAALQAKLESARLLLEDGEHAAAKAVLRPLLQAHPEDPAVQRLMLAVERMEHNEAQERAEEERIEQQRLADAQRHVEVALAEAEAYADARDFTRALEAVGQARAVRPKVLAERIAAAEDRVLAAKQQADAEAAAARQRELLAEEQARRKAEEEEAARQRALAEQAAARQAAEQEQKKALAQVRGALQENQRLRQELQAMRDRRQQMAEEQEALKLQRAQSQAERDRLQARMEAERKAREQAAREREAALQAEAERLQDEQADLLSALEQESRMVPIRSVDPAEQSAQEVTPPPPAAPSPQDDERALATAVAALDAAYAAEKVDGLVNLMAAPMPIDERANAEAFFEKAEAVKSRHDIDADSIRIEADRAELQGTWSLHYRMAGQPVAVRMQRTLVFERLDGAWKLTVWRQKPLQ